MTLSNSARLHRATTTRNLVIPQTPPPPPHTTTTTTTTTASIATATTTTIQNKEEGNIISKIQSVQGSIMAEDQTTNAKNDAKTPTTSTTVITSTDRSDDFNSHDNKNNVKQKGRRLYHLPGGGSMEEETISKITKVLTSPTATNRDLMESIRGIERLLLLFSTRMEETIPNRKNKSNDNLDSLFDTIIVPLLIHGIILSKNRSSSSSSNKATQQKVAVLGGGGGSVVPVVSNEVKIYAIRILSDFLDGTDEIPIHVTTRHHRIDAMIQTGILSQLIQPQQFLLPVDKKKPPQNETSIAAAAAGARANSSSSSTTTTTLSQCHAVIVEILTLLCIIAEGSERHVQAVMDAGILDYFPYLLNYPNEQIREKICMIALNIVTGTHDQMVTLINCPGVLQLIIKYASSAITTTSTTIDGEESLSHNNKKNSTSRLKTVALLTLSNCFYDCSAGNHDNNNNNDDEQNDNARQHAVMIPSLLVSMGALYPLVNGLSLDNDDGYTLWNVMDAILHILNVSEHYHLDYKDLLIKYDVIEKLESFLNPPHWDLYNKAFKLMNKFFE